MKNISMMVGLLVLVLLPRQVTPCNSSRSWSSEWIQKHNQILKQEEQERLLRLEEKNKTEAEELLRQIKKKEKQGFKQEPQGPSIYEEERILDLMEEEELPSSTGKKHHFVPAEE